MLSCLSVRLTVTKYLNNAEQGFPGATFSNSCDTQKTHISGTAAWHDLTLYRCLLKVQKIKKQTRASQVASMGSKTMTEEITRSGPACELIGYILYNPT